MKKLEERAESKVFLDVPFKMKDFVRNHGARWDLKEKKW
jgi:hypothetical protein